MIKKKFFLSFVNEKRWLEKMNGDGFELVKAAPFTYQLEKTDKKIIYEYVCFKHGKRDFDNFNYKLKDSGAKAVYLNGETALFKKDAQKGEFTLFASADEKKLNYLRRRSSLYMTSLCFLAASVCCLMLYRRLEASIMLAFCIACALLTLSYFVQSFLLDRYIKKM